MGQKPPPEPFPRRPVPAHGTHGDELPTLDPKLQCGLDVPDDGGIPLAADETQSATAPAHGLPVVDTGGMSGIDAAALEAGIVPTPGPAGSGMQAVAGHSTGPGGLDEEPPRPKIRALGMKKRHEDEWDRTPNVTGTGAIHVRSFHCKLTDDAIAAMDRRVNEWLDAHPQYEVKFVNSTVGIVTGKSKEPHLLCQVWV